MVIFLVLSLLAMIMMKLANKRRGVAIAFAVLVQMLLPDPLIEKTITMVVCEKRATKKQQEKDGEGKGLIKKRVRNPEQYSAYKDARR